MRVLYNAILRSISSSRSVRRGGGWLGGTLLLLMLYGCPYESEVPLCERPMAVDKTLLGTWQYNKPGDSTLIMVSEVNEHYDIVQKDKSGESTEFEGFVCMVKNVRFLHVYEKGASPAKYSLYRLDAYGQKVVLKPISERDKELMETSAKLLAFIEKHMDEPGFYDPPEEYLRVR